MKLWLWAIPLVLVFGCGLNTQFVKEGSGARETMEDQEKCFYSCQENALDWNKTIATNEIAMDKCQSECMAGFGYKETRKRFGEK